MIPSSPTRSTLWTLLLAGVAGPSTAFASSVTCDGDRYISVARVRSDCATPPGSPWNLAPLFSGDIGGELSRYCLFTWQGQGAPRPDLLPPVGTGADAPALDCAVIVPHATELTMENQAAMEAAFRTQVDALTSLPTPTAASLAQPPSKVIVVDSSRATGFPFPAEGLIEHGKMVGMVVRQLACPAGGTCAAEVANTLALPLTKAPGGGFQRNPNGGRFGSFGDLALAIHQGVATAATQAGKTVMNISIGWDGTLYGGAFVGDDWASLSPPIRSIYSAISLAYCRGALVIAAAGNASDGPAPSAGPTHPAAWEAKPAPTAARCAVLAPGVALPNPVTSYRRMIYAVSGVDGRDLDLANRRPSSRPPLVGPADHVTISNGAAEITDVFTGSSVAAAVASAAAAISWRYRPNQSSHDAMKLVRDGGVLLGGKTVEFARESCLAPDCTPNVARVSICGTLKRLQTLGFSTNPNCTKSVAFRDERPVITTDSLSPLVCAQPASTPVPAIAPCEGEYYSAVAGISQSCPANQLANHLARPFSTPQPDGIACPTCPMIDLSAVINLNPDYAGLLSKPTIVIKPIGGTEKIVELSIDPVALGNTDPIKVTNLPFSSAQTEWATVDFEVEADSGPYSSSSPLIIKK